MVVVDDLRESRLAEQQRAEQIVSRLDGIATLPEVTARIMQIVSDPASTPDELYRIISHDPALVTRTLRLVNSSYFGLARRVDSVERAIVLVGFSGIRNLALAASMGQLFKGVLCDGFKARDLWNHCISVSVVARELAVLSQRHEIAEEVFLAGMVHDLGLLAALQLYPAQSRQVCRLAKDDPTPYCVLEQDLMGIDHQQLGAALARKWKFPDSCQAICQDHHHPEEAQEAYRHQAMYVHAADLLCCSCKVGFYLTAVHQPLQEAFFHGYIPLPVLQSTQEGLPGIVHTATQIFG